MHETGQNRRINTDEKTKRNKKVIERNKKSDKKRRDKK